MEQYVIKGGNPLVGEVEIAGAKNAALAILAAAIMTDETILIENLPDVRDINVLLEAIAGIGAQVADKELERVDGIAVDLQEAANQDTQEQRRVDFLGDQSQDDGDDRGEQSPEGCVHLHDFLSSFLFAKHKQKTMNVQKWNTHGNKSMQTEYITSLYDSAPHL